MGEHGCRTEPGNYKTDDYGDGNSDGDSHGEGDGGTMAPL
jgi:hypothetical protein